MGPPSSLLFLTVDGEEVEGHRRRQRERMTGEEKTEAKGGEGRRKGEGRGERKKIRKETMQDGGSSSPSSSTTTVAKVEQSFLFIKERKERELKKVKVKALCI